MSWQASRWAVCVRAGSSGAKAVLMVLAEAAKDDACSLAHDVIADRAEIGRRSVIRHMQELEGAGLISRDRRFDAYGNRAADLVRLHRSDAAPSATVAPSPSATPAPGDAATKCQIVHHQVPNTTPPSATVAQQVEVSKSSNCVEAQKPTRRKPETPIPDDFPDAAAIATGQEYLDGRGLNISAAGQAQRFRNHALQNDRRVRDWSAAFRNWLIKVEEFAPATARTFRPTIAEPIEVDWSARVADFKRNGFWNVREWGAKPGKAGCTVPAEILARHGFRPVIAAIEGDAA